MVWGRRYVFTLVQIHQMSESDQFCQFLCQNCISLCQNKSVQLVWAPGGVSTSIFEPSSFHDKLWYTVITPYTFSPTFLEGKLRNCPYLVCIILSAQEDCYCWSRSTSTERVIQETYYDLRFEPKWSIFIIGSLFLVLFMPSG